MLSKIVRFRRFNNCFPHRCLKNSVSREIIYNKMPSVLAELPKDEPKIKYGSSKEEVFKIVKDINDELKRPKTAVGDLLINRFTRLNELQCKLPLTYLMDTAKLFSIRNDAFRLELLVNLLRKNFSLSFNKKKPEEKLVIKSLPSNHPINKLISYSISTLFQNGNIDDAMKFWIRMSNSGYEIDRVGLEKIIDKLVSRRSSPPFYIIEKIQDQMKKNYWDQNFLYYFKQLKVFKHMISKESQSYENLVTLSEKVDEIWTQYKLFLHESSQYTEIKLNPPLDILSLKALCDISLSSQSKKIPGVSSEDIEIRKKNATQSFRELIEASRTRRLESNIDSESSPSQFGEKIFEQIKTMLDVNIHNAPLTFSSSENSVTENKKIRNIPINSPYSMLFFDSSYSRSRGLFRNSVTNLLSQVSHDGDSEECCKQLESLIDLVFEGKPAKKKASILIENKHVGKFGQVQTYSNSYWKNILMLDFLSDRDRLRDIHFKNEYLRENEPFKVLENAKFRGKDVDWKLFKSLSPYLMEDIEWVQYLVEHLLRNFVVKHDHIDGLKNKQTFIFDEIFKFTNQINQIASKNQIILPNQLAYSQLDVLNRNITALYKSFKREVNWIELYQLMNYISDSHEDKIGRSSEVYHGKIKNLCATKHDKALFKALDLLKDMIRMNIEIYPASLTAILDSSVSCLRKNDMLEVIKNVENVLKFDYSKNFDNDSYIRTMKALVYANARVNRGFRALEYAHRIRKIGGSLERRHYIWIINALYSYFPSNEDEWTLAKSPKIVVNWFLREMNRDGLNVDSFLFSKLIKIYIKAYQILKFQQGSFNKAATDLENMFQLFITKGYNHHPKVELTPQIVKEMVKFFCMEGGKEMAMDFIDEVEELYDLKPPGICYEPVVFKEAVLNRDLDSAQDIVLSMMNKNVLITDSIVDSIVMGYLKRYEYIDALDKVQELYNQHRVRPTVWTWMRLLEACFKDRNEYEANRVVTVINQMYTDKEKKEIVGPVVAPEYSLDRDLNLAKYDPNELDEEEEIRKDQLEREDPNNTNPFKKEKKPRRKDEFSVVPMGYQIKLGVPIGEREKGVLAHESLSRRFKSYGFKLTVSKD